MVDFSKENYSYVALILDEIYIKDVIYDKHEGTFIGFSNHLMIFEKDLNGESQSMPNIADTMLVSMV